MASSSPTTAPAAGQRPCRLCGAPLLFARSESGALLPLDRRAQVYRVTRDDRGQLHAVRDVASLVSHFATCPKANEARTRTTAPPVRGRRPAPPRQGAGGGRR